MYHIYTSPSLVLVREPSGDSAYFRIMTRDYGLVIARAQGIRRDTSRLKGVLQEFSLATVAYIRTKAGWKITTAIAEENFVFEAKAEQKRVMARIADCLARFIQGEESNTDIFSLVVAGFSALRHTTGDTHGIELLMLIRILFLLGYVDADEDIQKLIHEYAEYTDTYIEQALAHRKKIIQLINRAFKESHL